MLLAIDPGLQGAFVLTDFTTIEVMKMPIKLMGKDKDIDYAEVCKFLIAHNHEITHVFLERAVPFGMGTKGAFSYGRGFAMIEIALLKFALPITYVEPSKWTKLMHAGIDRNLKPKVRSDIAVKRLYPTLIASLPQKSQGVLHDGAVDALLIAGYGQRQLNGGL